MLQLQIGRRFQFLDDTLGKLFAKLNAPLVEGVDIPDHSLGKYAVFIESNQCSKRIGTEAFGKNRVGGTVAGKASMWTQPFRCSFGLNLIPGFTKVFSYR